MSQAALEEVVDSLVRVAWAAAAGQLRLANSPLPSREGTHFITSSAGRRSRQSSTGSGTSSGSDGESSLGLHGGICGVQDAVDRKDSLLAQEALGFLFSCLELRQDVSAWFCELRCVRDFVLDVLLGCGSEEVRCAARDGLHRLSRTVAGQTPLRSFLLQLLLKAHLPLWVPSSYTRGSNQRLLGQCVEYFDLACRLLADSKGDAPVDVAQMLEDEIAWLHSFSPSESPNDRDMDATLMTGHFHLIRTLVACNGDDRKADAGQSLVLSLLESYLFPASSLVEKSTKDDTQEPAAVEPKCAAAEARTAAFDILVELAKCCPTNMECIVRWLVDRHHRLKSELVKEFEYEPLIAGRAESGYVGLKNAGATCYMNSVLQQLFMQPGLQEAVLAIDSDKVEEDSLLFQTQSVFGHLLESQLEYHVPEQFWQCFRLWGAPVNVREQQDAFEFFNHLLDQVDEYLLKIGCDPVFKPFYEGTFSDQKICQGCPHRYEREETFLALNLPVKSQSLKESLDQFVKGELLEGDNAYLCEKCGQKRNTVKRTCIKRLPQVLVIQLKRFGFDWEANRAVKFDYHFKFPWSLDMSPYTLHGVMEQENRSTGSGDPLDEVFRRPPPALYELTGVVVHNGQASAGHYYSYIRERRNDPRYVARKGTWYKFNDTTVEQFDLNDSTLETECFGGTYKAKVSDSASCYPETRQRHWNAYLLFYEKQEDSRTPRTPHKTPGRFSFRREPKDSTPIKSSSVRRTPSASAVAAGGSSARQRGDSLSQLTRLVDHGERQGWFPSRMPAHIGRQVREQNLLFARNRDVYNTRYFDFVAALTSVNMDNIQHPEYDQLMVHSLNLVVNFFLNTYLKYKKKDSSVIGEWVKCIETIMSLSEDAALWLLQYIANAGPSVVKLYLLECLNKEVRHTFAQIVEKALVFCHKLEGSQADLDTVGRCLINLLDQDVADNCWHSSQYFCLLSNYTQLGTKACEHLFKLGAFEKLMVFLLGPLGANMASEESFTRRWSHTQIHEFGYLHSTLINLVLACDLSCLHSCALLDAYPESSDLLPMPEAVRKALSGPGASRYLREVVSACRETTGFMDILTQMILQCSICNEPFSSLIIRLIMIQYSMVPSNELKNLSQLLLELLKLDDPLQCSRIRLVIDGSQESRVEFDGLLEIIKSNHTNDSRRSYQGVKLLVTMANRCMQAKDYLLQAPPTWQWSVNWLKQTMSEFNTQWSSNTSNEDSNTKTFQRTISAQDTLAEATALLTELSSPEATELSMEMDQDEAEDEDSRLKRTRGLEDVFSNAEIKPE